MKKILVVEDEPKHLKTIIEYLTTENQNYEIISAGNGSLACSIAEAEIPDLIIMDWELPVMNGIDATIKLKNTKKTCAIPVIMCTGVMMTSHDLQTAFNAGAIDYIRKPIDRIELISRVRSMLMLADYFNQKNIADGKVDDLTKVVHEQEMQLLQTELDFKNQELTAKALFMIQKDEVITKTVNSLHQISKSGEAVVIDKIVKLIKDLQAQQKGKIWREFEGHFEKVHREFYARLNSKYPDLTTNEKRICAFIRLNLTTKDICALTQQSIKSIEVARTRLRQKMALPRNENLSTLISML